MYAYIQALVFHLAYPFSDPSINTSYEARLGEPLVMRCTIPFGALRERYSVRWFRGLTEIDPDESQHISVRDDGALVFAEVRISDVNRGYYCKVKVSRIEGNVTRKGSTIALNILGKYKCI